MTFQEMCTDFQKRTGRTAWIDNSHPAGPSIAARGNDKQVHGIVIPIDDESRTRAVDALVSYTA